MNLERPKTRDADDAAEPTALNLITVAEAPIGKSMIEVPLDRHQGDRRSLEGEKRVPASELPEGRPTVGPGTTHSDIIRDTHPDDVRFHLGPLLRRGDVVTPPVVPPTIPPTVEVPPSAVPGDHVHMQNVGASPQFVERMRDQMDKLPPNVRKLLSDQQMTVVLGDKMPDAAPDLRNTQPRGWPEGTTFANEDGAFRPEKRQILVTETFLDQKTGKDERTNRAESVLRHETGHAVDAALDNYSQSAEFKAAYDKDVAALPADVKDKLKYLMQSEGAGAQETFAEVFAALNGGSANPEQSALILASFPEVTAMVKKKLASV